MQYTVICCFLKCDNEILKSVLKVQSCNSSVVRDSGSLGSLGMMPPFSQTSVLIPFF